MAALSFHGETSSIEELIEPTQRHAQQMENVDAIELQSQHTSNTDLGASQFLTKTQFEEVQRRKYALARGFAIEFFSYILFLIVFMVVTYSLRSSWIFWNSEVVRQVLLQPASDEGFGPQLSNLRDVQSFWFYFENAFFPKMYPNTYEGSGETLNDYDQKFMIEHNFRIGAMRWRQVRVKLENNCSVDPAFQGFISSCYPTMAEAREETKPFGPNGVFQWKNEADLCGAQEDKSFCSNKAMGLRSDNVYPGSGYAWDFSLNGTALQELQFLKQSSFIDAATRAIAIDFTVFNPNVYLVVACHILVEFYPSGQLVTTSSVKPVPLMALEVKEQRFELAGEILLALFVAGYIIRELQEFIEHKSIKPEHCTICIQHQRPSASSPQKEVECYLCGRHFNPFAYMHCPLCQREIEENHICWKGYFLDPWNVIDLINLLIFIAVLALRLRLRFLLCNYNFNVGDGFLQFYPVANRYYMGSWLNSFNALLCFLKLFKYLARIKQLKVLIRALAYAGEELLYFVIIFFVVFLGFAMSFHMAFAGDVPDFANWFTSCYSLFSLIMGQFDYYALQQSNRVLAPLFFFSYLSLVWLVLVNMFVAIISGSYDAAANDLESASDDFLSSSLKLFWREMRMKYLKWLFGENNKLQRVQRLLAAIEQLNTITEEQKDEVRCLQREITYATSNAGLLSKILKEFPNKPHPVPCDAKDFSHLRRTVVEHKRLVRLEKFKKSTFDVDEYDTLELMMNPAGHFSEEEAARMKERLIGPDGNPLSAMDLIKQVQRQQQMLEHKFEDLLNALDMELAADVPHIRRSSQNSGQDVGLHSRRSRRKSSIFTPR